jgi:hypothetical protein
VIDHSFPAAEGTANPVGALFRGSIVPAGLGLALLALIGAAFGLDQVKSSLVGGALAALAMSVGPLLHLLCRNLDPALTIGIAVLAYCAVVGLFGLGFSLLNDTSWLVGGFAALGVIVVSVAWAVGHMRAALSLRQPLYQHDDRTAER